MESSILIGLYLRAILYYLNCNINPSQCNISVFLSLYINYAFSQVMLPHAESIALFFYLVYFLLMPWDIKCLFFRYFSALFVVMLYPVSVNKQLREPCKNSYIHVHLYLSKSQIRNLTCLDRSLHTSWWTRCFKRFKAKTWQGHSILLHSASTMQQNAVLPIQNDNDQFYPYASVFLFTRTYTQHWQRPAKALNGVIFL